MARGSISPLPMAEFVGRVLEEVQSHTAVSHAADDVWYVLAPDAWRMHWASWIFFGVLITCNVVTSIIVFSLAAAMIKRWRSPSRELYDASAERRMSVVDSVTVILPCYLPNEAPILMETVNHIMTMIQYPEPFTLILVYNTPKSHPMEDRLAELDGRVYENGRTLRVMKVEGSTSKAENLNAAMPFVDGDNVMIYDADHHADPTSLLIATAHMKREQCQCVQGSTYIRQKSSLLARIIDAEFFVIFFCFFPAVEYVTRMGIFGGSNALWKTDVLRKYEFRNDVMTEDIELSTRVIMGNVKISFCPDSRSGELPPASFRALWRQRLRWEVGWDQVTMGHFRDIWTSKLTVQKKFALCYWLPWRWLMLLTASINAFLTPLLSVSMPSDSLGAPIRLMMDYALLTFLVTTVFIVANAFLIAKRSEWLYITCFQLAGSFYLIWNIVIVSSSLFRILTGLASGHGFVPTERAVTKSAERPVAAVELSVAVAPLARAGDKAARLDTSPPQEPRDLKSTDEGSTRDIANSDTMTSPVRRLTASNNPEARRRAQSMFGFQFAIHDAQGKLDEAVGLPTAALPGADSGAKTFSAAV